MDLQYISIFFYAYIFGGIIFYLILEKIIKDIIANDELFEKLQEETYKSTGFRINKDLLWTAIHTPKAMVLYIIIYPVILLSPVIKHFLKKDKGDQDD